MSPLPAWVGPWCREHLGSVPAGALFASDQTASVWGVRLDDGAEVVLKARDDDDGRAAACVQVQARLAARGYPCPRPLTAVVVSGGRAVHAEEFRPGGEVVGGDGPEIGRRYGRAFGRLLRELDTVRGSAPLPSPRWVRWDHPGNGVWPAIGFLDAKDQALVPRFVVDVAVRVRARLRRAEGPWVLGHADFEAQNLRWRGPSLWAVHDWDSLARQPEAALVGAASGAFPRLPGEQPSLTSVEGTEAFLDAYQEVRGRRLGPDGEQIAWAASLWPVAHNARWDALHGRSWSRSGEALVEQAALRLTRAGA